MPKIIKEYEDKSMNIPTCMLKRSQIEFIQKCAKQKGIKQSQLVREIVKEFYAKHSNDILPKLVNEDTRDNRDRNDS